MGSNVTVCCWITALPHDMNSTPGSGSTFRRLNIAPILSGLEFRREAKGVPESVVSGAVSLKFVRGCCGALTCNRIRQNSDASGNCYEFRCGMIHAVA